MLPLLSHGTVFGAQAITKRPRPGGITERVLELRQVVVQNINDFPEYHSDFTHQEQIQAFLAAALYTNPSRRPMAVLYIDYRQPRQYSPEDRNFFHVFVNIAQNLLQQTWMLYRYSAMTQIGVTINQDLSSIDEIFKILVEHTADILDVSGTFVMVSTRFRGREFDFYIHRDGEYTRQLHNPFEGFCRWMFEHQERLLINHLSEEGQQVEADLHLLPGSTGQEESLLFVPLLLHGQCLGMLGMLHPKAHQYDSDDIKLLNLVSNQVAAALNSMRLFASLRQVNRTGQSLVRELVSHELLSTLVEQIRQITRADNVILYTSDEETQQFHDTPTWSGKITYPERITISLNRPTHAARRVLDQSHPIYERHSTHLYNVLDATPSVDDDTFAEREYIASVAAVPLRDEDKPLGVLFINFRRTQSFDAPQREVIGAMANYASIAIRNARLYSEIENRRTSELESFQIIGRALAQQQALGLQAVLDQVLQLAQRQIPRANESAIIIYNEITDALETRAVAGTNAETRKVRLTPLDKPEEQGLIGWVFKHKKPLRVDNVTSDPEWSERYIRVVEEIRSEIDVPLLDGNHAIGVINMLSEQEAAFTEGDQDFLTTLAGHAVLAIKTAQAAERGRQLVSERQAILEIANDIASQTSRDTLFDLILDKALTLTDARHGSLDIYNSSTDRLELAASRGGIRNELSRVLQIGEGIVGEVARRRKPLNVPSVQAKPWSKIARLDFKGTRSELAVPLIETDSQGVRLWGVLNVEHEEKSHFTEDHERLLTSVANLAVLALQNAERFELQEAKRKQAEALQHIDQAIIQQSVSADAVYEAILAQVHHLINPDISYLILFRDEVPERLCISVLSTGVADAQHDINWFEHADMDPFIRDSITGIVSEQDQIDNVWYTEAEDLTRCIAPLRETADPETGKSPQIHGVLVVEWSSSRPISQAEKQDLILHAGQAMIALQRFQRDLAIQRGRERFKLLYEVGQKLARITGPGPEQEIAVYRIVGEAAEDIFNCRVVIRKYDEFRKSLQLVFASQSYEAYKQNLAQDLAVDGTSANAYVARTRKPLNTPDLDQPPPEVELIRVDRSMRSHVIAPIEFAPQYYGNLGLLSEEIGRFDEPDVELVMGLAGQLALTLYRLEMEQMHLENEFMRDFGQASYELAHKLGNQIGPLPARIQMIEQKLRLLNVDNAEIVDNLARIAQRVQKSLTFSRALRDLGLSESQKTTLPERVSIEELLNAACEGKPDESDQVTISIEIALNDHSVYHVEVIKEEIINALQNLLTNAIEAMPEGGAVTFRVNSRHDFVDIQVSDTGIGIDPQNQERIFQLFYTTKEDRGNSGFGLWSVKRNVQRSGGWIDVSSEPGRGTTFTITLPCQKGSQGDDIG